MQQRGLYRPLCRNTYGLPGINCLGRGRTLIPGWRGVVMTPRPVAEIERLRRAQTNEPDQASTSEEVIAAQDCVHAELR